MSASSSSSACPRGPSVSPAWSTDATVALPPRGCVVRTTEKSVTLRVRMEEKLSDGRGKSDERSVSSRSSSDGSKRLLKLPPSETMDAMEDADVHEMLAELYTEVERKKQWLNREEDSFQHGQERLRSLQQEHRALLDMLQQCKWRRREKTRIQKLLEGPRSETRSVDSADSDSGSDSDRSHKRRRHSSSRGSSHHLRPKDGARKERKRLRRFQSDVSLRFQLLQSECRRTDLQVDKLMADLRREYADSCLFGNAINF